jgi:DNA-directed RNA polymerase subunit F
MIDRGLCVTIYTQITDVEDEINGLYTYDRKICKVDAETMRKITEDLRAAFDERHKHV